MFFCCYIIFFSSVLCVLTAVYIIRRKLEKLCTTDHILLAHFMLLYIFLDFFGGVNGNLVNFGRNLLGFWWILQVEFDGFENFWVDNISISNWVETDSGTSGVCNLDSFTFGADVFV